MRRISKILSMVAVILMAAGLVAQTKPSFAGVWKIAGDSNEGGGQGLPGPDLTITQGPTAMTLEYRGSGPAQAPRKLTYKLDGSVSRNQSPTRAGAPAEQSSKAEWSGNNLVVTTTTAAGEEKRTLSVEGGNLVIETSAPARNGGARNVTKVTYKRYERGFGG
jgi:hypothetical protein